MRGTLAAVLAFSAYLVSVLGSDYPAPAGCPECDPGRYVTKSIPAKAIALTFDDGPHPEATRRILDILDSHGVQGTFFLLGQNALKHPEIVRDIYARGHLIGNHGMSHSRKSHSSVERIQWELNNTNRVIEEITGRSAILYRPPYLMDLEDNQVVTQGGESAALDWASENGYIVVGTDLDPLDWAVRQPDDLVKNVVMLLNDRELNPGAAKQHVLMFHDIGVTADSLDRIIALLKRNGYEIVPLESLLGMKPGQGMPQAAAGGPFRMPLMSYSHALDAIAIGMLAITLFALARPLALILAKRFARDRRRESLVGLDRLTVSVIVPAYNEAENIKATLMSLIGGTRRPDEIIVVNDGSTDDTESYAREVEFDYPELVHVVRIPNGGKANALNLGISVSSGDIVVCIDGDTVLDRECVERLVSRFADPEVGAVSGKLVPANQKTLLEKFQTIEYFVGQNIDKAAFSKFGAVGVVPGAAGAWRRDLIEQAGGYSHETIVEDQDLTLAVLSLGYKVAYEEKALSYTEVPSTYSSFFMQRFRWTFGTFQCMWKYRASLFSLGNPRLGWLALAHAVLYNVVMPLVGLVVFASTVFAASMGVVQPVLVFFFQYTVIEMAIATYALSEERGRKASLAAYVILSRVAYLLAYTGILALVSAKVLDGSGTKWNKFARAGSAQRLFDALEPASA